MLSTLDTSSGILVTNWVLVVAAVVVFGVTNYTGICGCVANGSVFGTGVGVVFGTLDTSVSC